MFLKEIDKKRTIANVRAFLKDDFDNLRKLSRADALIAAGTPTEKNREVLSNLQHYSYKQLYGCCVKAIDNCSKENMTILKRVFIKGDKNFVIQMSLNISSAEYGRQKRKALLEFADRLFGESSQINREHPIDLRIYGDSE